MDRGADDERVQRHGDERVSPVEETQAARDERQRAEMTHSGRRNIIDSGALKIVYCAIFFSFFRKIIFI